MRNGELFIKLGNFKMSKTAHKRSVESDESLIPKSSGSAGAMAAICLIPAILTPYATIAASFNLLNLSNMPPWPLVLAIGVAITGLTIILIFRVIKSDEKRISSAAHKISDGLMKEYGIKVLNPSELIVRFDSEPPKLTPYAILAEDTKRNQIHIKVNIDESGNGVIPTILTEDSKL